MGEMDNNNESSLFKDYEREWAEREGWRSEGYTGEACPNCGRMRLEKHRNGRVTCDKCHWEPAVNGYAEGKPDV